MILKELQSLTETNYLKLSMHLSKLTNHKTVINQKNNSDATICQYDIIANIF